MKQVAYKQYKEDDMDSIDVHDLPEEQAQLLAAFAEFLRQRRWPATEEAPRTVKERKPPRELLFAAWPLGVKGNLSREEIYEHL